MPNILMLKGPKLLERQAYKHFVGHLSAPVRTKKGSSLLTSSPPLLGYSDSIEPSCSELNRKGLNNMILGVKHAVTFAPATPLPPKKS